MVKSCAIVGCTVNSKRCKGVTFHLLPKCEKHKEWRAMLIAKINRIDKSFNPNKAMLCSRHFTASCFKYGNFKKTLIPNSLPTEFMPVQSIVTPKPKERKPPALRVCSEPPKRVAYFRLEEILNDAKKLTSPWFILQIASDFFRLGFISDENQGENLLITITVRDTLVAHVMFLGKETRTQNLEDMKLGTYLSRLTSHNRCIGIMDPDLQEFAGLPITEKDVYFRHLTYGFSEGRYTSNSTVRSVDCVYFTVFETCTRCRKIKSLLLKKVKRDAQHVGVINKYTPLHFLSKNTLKQALIMTRQNNRTLESEIELFKKTETSTSVENRTLEDDIEQLQQTNTLTAAEICMDISE